MVPRAGTTSGNPWQRLKHRDIFIGTWNVTTLYSSGALEILTNDQTGEWRRLHNGELLDLYWKPDIIRIVKSRRLRWAGHVTRMGNERGAWKLVVGKPEGKRPVGRPRIR